jgi:transcriptional regulator
MKENSMLLPNGSMINQDVIESFDRAVSQPENIKQGVGTVDFWNFVNSDMYFDLKMIYNGQYIDECMDALADRFEGVV